MKESSASERADRILEAMIANLCDRAAGLEAPTGPSTLDVLAGQLADLDDAVRHEVLVRVCSRAVTSAVVTATHAALRNGTPILECLHGTNPTNLEDLMAANMTASGAEFDADGFGGERCVGGWRDRQPCVETPVTRWRGRPRCKAHWEQYAGRPRRDAS